MDTIENWLKLRSTPMFSSTMINEITTDKLTFGDKLVV